MEAFEAFVALTMEAEDDLVVSEAVKFPVTRRTAKSSHAETQTHGFEVDLVGARSDRLVLATVKSFFGSRGVVADSVLGIDKLERGNRLYALLNDQDVRAQVIAAAARRYGYKTRQIELRLYVGRFAGGKSGEHERRIRDWCSKQRVGTGPIKVYAVEDVAHTAVSLASTKTYRDNPALVAVKVLAAAGMINTR